MEPYVVMLRTDADDRDTTEEMLAETGNPVNVKFVADLRELADLIRTKGDPLLVLLNDRGAAHADHEQLRKLRSDPASAHIPVILLGEMSTKEYIMECYRAGASSFIIKPSTLAETKKKIERFFDYWLNVAET
jgi:CheY-like chemotaxis protein